MKKNLFTLVKFGIGWPLSFFALYFIFKIISPETGRIIAKLENINYFLLTAGFASFFIYFLLRGVLWLSMLEEKGHKHLSFRESTFLWASSEFKRYIPGNIWSFLGKTILFSAKNIPTPDILGLMFWESILLTLGALLASLSGLRFVLLMLLPHNKTVDFLTWFIFSLCALVTLFIIYLKKANNILPSMRIKKFFHTYFFDPPNNSKFILISLTAYFFFGFGYFLTAASIINFDIRDIWKWIGFFNLVYLLGYLSLITPTGLGVREALITLGLSKITTLSLSGFVSIFTRVVLILAEIIFLTIFFALAKIRSVFLDRFEAFLRKNWQEVTLGFLIVLYCLYFTLASFLRFDNFYTGRFDLGNMAQTVWNTAHGRIFTLTNPNGTDVVSRLSTHADFLLILLAPFYYLWPNPKNLLLIQTIVVSFGAVFVYLLSRDILKNKGLSLALAFSYLLNPGVQRSNLYDFHAVTLATTFLLAAFYFLRKYRYLPFALFAFLAAITKEQVWVIIGLFGLYMAFIQRKKVLGVALLIICFTVFYYLIARAIPQALGSKHFALSYYSDFGEKPSSIIKNIIFSPLKTSSVMLRPDRLKYLLQVFTPLGFVSFLAPFFLIFALPDLVINLLSSNSQLHQIYYQYTSTITPFLFIATLYGLFYLKKLFPKIPFFLLTMYILFWAFLGSYLFGPLPFAKEPNIDMFTKQLPERKFIQKYLQSIPRRYSVAASNNLGSHLSQRQNIYTIPLGIDQADIITLLPDPTTPQMSKEQKTIVKKLYHDPNYSLLLQKDGFIVFKRRDID